MPWPLRSNGLLLDRGAGAQPIWRLCCSLLCGRFRVDAKTLRVSGATPNLLLDVVLLDRRLRLLFLS